MRNGALLTVCRMDTHLWGKRTAHVLGAMTCGECWMFSRDDPTMILMGCEATQYNTDHSISKRFSNVSQAYTASQPLQGTFLPSPKLHT